MVKGQLNAKRLEPFLKDDALALPAQQQQQQQPDLSCIDEADKVDEIVVTNVRLELVILYTDRDQCPEAHPLLCIQGLDNDSFNRINDFFSHSPIATRGARTSGWAGIRLLSRRRKKKGWEKEVVCNMMNVVSLETGFFFIYIIISSLA